MLALCCLVVGMGVGLVARDFVRGFAGGWGRRPRCAWCDVPTPRGGLCAECLGHDRDAMAGWQ
jgi:hypothetical protein